MEAARLSQGVALVSELLLHDAGGKFVAILPSSVEVGGYYFAAPVRRWNDGKIASLRDWVKKCIKRGHRQVALVL
jgi:LysR family transcriptional regulator, glycine cleavage system transcriptional activator